MKKLIILISLSFLFPQNKDTYVDFFSLIKKEKMYYYSDKLFSGYSKTEYRGGIEIILFENGIRKSYEMYTHGENPSLIESGIWNEGKKELVEFVLENDGKPFIDYYENGNIYREGKVRKTNHGGIWFGPYKEYHKNGQLWIEGTYGDYSEERVGQWKYYYENGQISQETLLPDGLYKKYYKNGQLKEEGKNISKWKKIFYKKYSETGEVIEINKEYIKETEDSTK